MAEQTDLAILTATSGHSGVDTIVRNLLPEFSSAGIRTDVLRIDNHGPELSGFPHGTREVRLGARHVETALPALIRYLRQKRPRVLLSDKDSVNRVALLARWMARVPTHCAVRLGTTVSVNLANKKPWQAYIQKQSIRRLYRYADTVIVPSRGAAEDLAHIMGCPASAITVLPNPIVRPELHQAAAAAIDEPWFRHRDRPVIVAVGSLTPRKDYATLLDAFARLRQERPARLIVVGDGKCRHDLESQAQSLGIADDIRFTGHLANPYPYLAAADVFAHTSRWEGLGIVLVEALALGTPVVATDCPSGPAEVLDNGRLGRLVPIGDAEAVAAACAATLDHRPDAALLREGVTSFHAGASAEAYLRAFSLPG